MDTNNTASGKAKPRVQQSLGVTQTPKQQSVLPGFHFATMLQWFQQRSNMLFNVRNNVIEQYNVYFTIGLTVPVITFLQSAVIRLINRHDPGSIFRAFGSTEAKWEQRVRDAVLQDLLRPIWYKLTYTDRGRVDFQMDYPAQTMSRGSSLLMDLILEPWSTIDLPGFGILKVVIKPERAMYTALSSKFDKQIKEFESMVPPYSDAGLDAVLISISKKVPNFDYGEYSFRKRNQVLPAIADLTFYKSETTGYVLTLISNLVNLLSMSLNYFLTTKIVDKDGSPILPGFELSAENTTNSIDVDKRLLSGLYRVDSGYDLTQLNEGLVYIYCGNQELFPTVNLGYKGGPSSEGGVSPVNPSGNGNSGDSGNSGGTNMNNSGSGSGTESSSEPSGSLPTMHRPVPRWNLPQGAQPKQKRNTEKSGMSAAVTSEIVSETVDRLSNAELYADLKARNSALQLMRFVGKFDDRAIALANAYELGLDLGNALASRLLR